MFFQGSLFGICEPAVDRNFAEARRIELDERSWVEFTPGWLEGADAVFDQLLATLELTQRTDIVMYDSVVAEPRLTAWWHAEDYPAGGPTPLLDDVRRLLTERHHRPFDSIGFNLYRDGDDSVAWHGDRHRRHVTDPVVVILSVGERRAFRLRPRADGAAKSARAGSLSWELGHGDLLVMGGACQHDWEHCVPKRRRPTGPRMSITFRHDTRDRSLESKRST